jgi:hypothetical protein
MVDDLNGLFTAAGAASTGKDSEMVVKGGRVVRTRGEETPYKVILDDDEQGRIEHPVLTVREGEALLREKFAAPPRVLHALREWNPLA